MIRRYVLPCVVILAVAAGATSLAYVGAKKKQFASTCVFQDFIHLGPTQPDSNDGFDFFNKMAAHEVTVAIGSGLYAQVGRSQEVSPGTLASNTTLSPVGGLALWSVQVIASNSTSAMQLTNAVCDGFVDTIKKLRTNEVNALVQSIEARMVPIEEQLNKLQAIPPARRTTSDNADLQTQREALAGNVNQIAVVRSLPPDAVFVLAGAVAGRHYDARSMGKYILIGVVAGLLTCFLYILIGEIAVQRRARWDPMRGAVSPREDVLTRP